MTNNKKSIVDEILGDLSKASAAKQIVLGTASGWVTGFVTMKVGKVAAIAVGGGILLLQIAQHKGYIKINWDKIQKSADKVVDKIEKETTGREPDVMDKNSCLSKNFVCIDCKVCSTQGSICYKLRRGFLARGSCFIRLTAFCVSGFKSLSEKVQMTANPKTVEKLSVIRKPFAE